MLSILSDNPRADISSDLLESVIGVLPQIRIAVSAIQPHRPEVGCTGRLTWIAQSWKKLLSPKVIPQYSDYVLSLSRYLDRVVFAIVVTPLSPGRLSKMW